MAWPRPVFSLTRATISGLFCLALTSTSAAQEAATCPVSGRVSAGAAWLPGVAVVITQDERVVHLVSTDEAGRWLGAVRVGTAYRVSFQLRGFAPVEHDVESTASCDQPLDVRLEVLRSIAAPSATPPTELAGTAVRGRDASVNRAALRERAAALARGEFALGALLPSTEVGTTERSPAVLPGRRGGTFALGSGQPGVGAQAAPSFPIIPAKRLYSATTSYTVAGSALDAAPYRLRPDDPPRRPDYLRQSADFTVGGPLAIPGVRGASRTTATLSYSAIRGGNLFDQYATVPTEAMRRGDLSAVPSTVRDPMTGLPFENGIIPSNRISPSAQSLLKFLPLPNGNGTSRNFHYTSTNASTQDNVNLRLTRPLAGTDSPSPRGNRNEGVSALSATLNAQIEYRRNVNDRLSALPAIAGVGTSTNLRLPVSLNVSRRGVQHSVSMGYTRNRNATTNRYAGVLDVAAQTGIAGTSPDPFAWGIPSLSFATLTSVNDLTPSDRTDQRVTLGYSWSRGISAHRVRLGGEVGGSRSQGRTDQNARGAFVFTGLYSDSDFADFLLGLPQQASVQYGPGSVRLSGRTVSLYAQDDWRRWSSVTLNAGVRYELVTPLRDDAGHLANLDVAPGFVAVSPVLSGASGPYSGPFPDGLVRTDTNNIAPRIGAAWRVAPRTTLRLGYGVSFNTGSYAGLARQLSSQPPFAVTNSSTGTTAQPLALTTSLINGSASTRNTFGVDRNYEAGVVRTWTIDLSRDMGDAWNLSAGVTRASGSQLDIVRAPNRGPVGLLLPDVQPFLWQTSEGRSRLRSATIRIRRWYVRGLSTSVNYTLARSMDNASTIGGGATVVAQDEQNLAAEWGVSSFSRRHQLSGDLNFELPFGDNHRWLNRGGPWAQVLGRWSAYVTFSAQTGTPLTARVLSSAVDVARGINGTLRADLTGEPVALDDPSAQRFFNTSAFSAPKPGSFGSAGRNVIVGPGSRDLSVQVTRDVPAGGTRTMSVQLRASNVLNLVNYGTVDTVVNSPTFGQVLSVRSRRSMQLNIRVKF
ncbi:MAG: hypothetical protein ABL986_07785 [Vicinamibacterales bacterium]